MSYCYIIHTFAAAKYCYDIPPFRPHLTIEEFGTLRGFSKQAGTWNRRNNSKNNGSMSFSSFVAFGRWNVVFALPIDI
ncbi:MAG TPA: hypothetical protein DDX57_12535 [Bacteroidales bacterium]|nr:hypothetical protein [Bacteroidales bacterium]HCB62134.1 hypothetical protein [Bacteroidales bacterium]